VHGWASSIVFAWAWSLVPLFAFAFAGPQIVNVLCRLPLSARLALPVLCAGPYLLVTLAVSSPRPWWVALYVLLPIFVAIMLWWARQADPQQLGNWRDFIAILGLGLAVDLRWLEPAWPAHTAPISKLILLDSGLYGFLVMRRLTGVGFDLRLQSSDVRTGLRELLFYAPIAIPLGLGLGFLHLHAQFPRLTVAALAWMFTFVFIAVPEEVYFRGWMQNLLERRLGRRWSLGVTALLFGLSHFNKRAAHFNWRYVVLAALAGIFYGRAWRQGRRVAASAITHATVDTVWWLWLG